MLSRFIAEGVIGGVGRWRCSFPQIMILFFLMTLLEDSGYLARGAALVDRPLSYLGLHGRSFVPMLSGFACAIPAVFAARAIPASVNAADDLDHSIDELQRPACRFMRCCSRRSASGAAWQEGLSLAAIYISSLLIGALVAGLCEPHCLQVQATVVLAMELPVYRDAAMEADPADDLGSRFVRICKRAGVPIMIVSAMLWLLSNFG